MERNGLRNFGRGSPKEDFCEIITTSIHQFRRKSLLRVFFFSFFYFLVLVVILFIRAEQFEQFGRGSPKKQFCEIILKSCHWPRRRCYLHKCFLLQLWWPFGSVEENHRNFDRKLSKEHFCEIVLKSGH